MDLDLGHVRSFLAVVDFGGYGRAAEALHLSQPAVSQHVRRLEAQLGGALFVRNGRGVEVSARGERASRELRELVATHDRAVARLTRDDPARAPFLFGAVEHVIDGLLPELLDELRTRTGRAVQLRIERSRVLRDRAATGELDAAIVLEPGELAGAVELGSVPLAWYAGGALARPGAPLPDPLPVVAYDAPCTVRDLGLDHLARAGRRTEITAESPHLSGVRAAVRAGLGVALLSGPAEGLRALSSPPFDGPQANRLWLVTGDDEAVGPTVLDAFRRASWRAAARGTTARRARPAA
jgi:DNA-binding transcriptional LysR family regulator